MDLTTLERYVLDEWIFIPVSILVMLWAFSLGFIIGLIIAHI